MSQEQGPKYIIPKETKVVSTQDSIDSAISEAFETISIEINRFNKKVKRNVNLTPEEARLLQGYIKSLIELSREAREKADAMDYANMSDAELAAFAQKLIKGK